MADTVSRKVRSRIMRAVKSRETKIEVDFRKALWREGVRYRKNVKTRLGKPDIVVNKSKVAIFVDSCFWHGCPKHCRMPSSKKSYWIAKIRRNRERDKAVTLFYKNNGWRIFRVWEHDLKNSGSIIKKIKVTLANAG